jgi:hypothetical protein
MLVYFQPAAVYMDKTLRPAEKILSPFHISSEQILVGEELHRTLYLVVEDLNQES